MILEGPKESVQEAMQEVRACMERPFDSHGLSELRGEYCVMWWFFVDLLNLHMWCACAVHLDVDAKSADSWYKAK